ncbi:MAG: hypothetical protein JW893_05740, partial [Candidatus Omnitrophica bacterium]|nr:hypothetical protein [Candidatus Omnitrophota bacterium]
MRLPGRRIISSFTLLFFVTTQLTTPSQGWAQNISVPSPQISEVKIPESFQITIPEDLGKIDHLESGSSKTIVHIQTAHGNFEAQKKIESLLHYLKEKYGFDLVLTEGASTKLQPDLIRFFPGRMDLTMAVAGDLAKKALVKGPELFLLKEGEAEAYGIEDEEIYIANGDAFREVITEEEKTNQFINETNLQIERLTSPYLNQDLRNFIRRIDAFESGMIPLEAWLTELGEKAKDILETDFTNPVYQIEWPMLVRISKLREFEEKIDISAYAKEREKFLQSIQKIRPELLEKIKELLTLQFTHNPLPDPETGLLFEAMVTELPKDFDYTAYPNLDLFIGHLILQSEIKGDLLVGEIETLTKKLAGALLENDKEREVWNLLKGHRLLGKLYRLELTPEDFAELLKRQDEIAPKNLIQRFQALNDKKQVRDYEFKHTEDLNRLYQKAVLFYEGVKKRDEVLLRNLEARLQETGKDKAVVVTGGFHANPFTHSMKDHGFSYALVTPKLTTTEGREAYLKATLQNQGAFFSKETRETSYLTQPLPRDGSMQFQAYEIATSIVTELSRAGIRAMEGKGVRVAPSKKNNHVVVGFDSPGLVGDLELLIPVTQQTEIVTTERAVLVPDVTRQALIRTHELQATSLKPQRQIAEAGSPELVAGIRSESRENRVSPVSEAIRKLDEIINALEKQTITLNGLVSDGRYFLEKAKPYIEKFQWAAALQELNAASGVLENTEVAGLKIWDNVQLLGAIGSIVISVKSFNTMGIDPEFVHVEAAQAVMVSLDQILEVVRNQRLTRAAPASTATVHLVMAYGSVKRGAWGYALAYLGLVRDNLRMAHILNRLKVGDLPINEALEAVIQKIKIIDGSTRSELRKSPIEEVTVNLETIIEKLKTQQLTGNALVSSGQQSIERAKSHIEKYQWGAAIKELEVARGVLKVTDAVRIEITPRVKLLEAIDQEIATVQDFNRSGIHYSDVRIANLSGLQEELAAIVKVVENQQITRMAPASDAGRELKTANINLGRSAWGMALKRLKDAKDYLRLAGILAQLTVGKVPIEKAINQVMESIRVLENSARSEQRQVAQTFAVQNQPDSARSEQRQVA